MGLYFTSFPMHRGSKLKFGFSSKNSDDLPERGDNKRLHPHPGFEKYPTPNTHTHRSLRLCLAAVADANGQVEFCHEQRVNGVLGRAVDGLGHVDAARGWVGVPHGPLRQQPHARPLGARSGGRRDRRRPVAAAAAAAVGSLAAAAAAARRGRRHAARAAAAGAAAAGAVDRERRQLAGPLEVRN